jgi:hypothetical protein
MPRHRSRVFRTLISAGTVVASAAGLTIIWWRGWMYSGWIGTPGVLPGILNSDGEAVYDAYAAEMFLFLVVCFTGIAFGISRLRSAT